MKIKKVLATAGCTVALGTVATLIYGFGSDKRNFEIIKNLDIFYSVFKELNTYYVDETDPKKLVKKAIDEMLSSLDPYTNYIPEEDMEDFRFITTGEYGGVGSIISMSDTCYVMFREVYQGMPADRAGVHNGDYIVEINGKDAKNFKVNEISEQLRGEPGTNTVLKIMRTGENKLIEKTIKREKVAINPVSYYGMLDAETGYIDMNNFTQDCAKEVKNALIDLKKNHGAKKLVLDLRENPGGLLDEAIKMVSLFVPKGSEVLSTKGKISMYDKTYKTSTEPIDTEIPIVVLVSRRSASASEIVAGALQDLDRAVIVGQRTFGKGLVQSTREIEYKGGLKITTAKYYIPSGRCIQAIDYSHRNKDGAVGLVPDSLISEFKTKGGRVVYDGGGVSPDVHCKLPDAANITYALVANDVIFRYAVHYRSTHPTIAPATSFTLSDQEYAEFCNFVSSQHKFTYKSESNEELKKLIKAAKRDQYYENNRELFDKMAVALEPNLKKDLESANEEIRQLIESEILVSYYFHRGAAPHALNIDPEVKTALETLNSENQYQGLLDGSVASHAGDKRKSIEKE